MMKKISEIAGGCVKEYGSKRVWTLDGTSVVTDARAGYDAVVSALVGAKYPADKQAALVANFATASILTEADAAKAEEYRVEFAEFASWRRRVKDGVRGMMASAEAAHGDEAEAEALAE